MKKAQFVCPNCGEEVPANAKACPHCGSDEKTGWSEHIYMDGISTPLEDDEYDEILEKEFPHERPIRRLKVSWIAIVGAVVLVLFLLGFLRGYF